MDNRGVVHRFEEGLSCEPAVADDRRMGEMARRRDLMRQGYTDYEIRRLYRYDRWRQLGHGCYVPETGCPADDAIARHRLLIESTLATMAPDAVVSHESAAVWYGLPVWGLALNVAQVTRDRSYGGRVGPAMKVHCAPIGDGVALVDGRLVTSPARTVVDIGRTVPFEQAVIIGDAAVRDLGIEGDELAAELDRSRRRRGAAAARRVVEFLDPRSESVGESRSRVMMRRMSLPAPISQVNIMDPAGDPIGRADFYWARHGVIG